MSQSRPMLNVAINNVRYAIPQGVTILRAAQDNDIYIHCLEVKTRLPRSGR